MQTGIGFGILLQIEPPVLSASKPAWWTHWMQVSLFWKISCAWRSRFRSCRQFEVNLIQCVMRWVFLGKATVMKLSLQSQQWSVIFFHSFTITGTAVGSKSFRAFDGHWQWKNLPLHILQCFHESQWNEKARCLSFVENPWVTEKNYLWFLWLGRLYNCAD